MNTGQIGKAIEFLSSEKFRKALDNIGKALLIAKPLIDRIKNRTSYYQQDREEKMNDGMNSDQYFNEKMEDFEEAMEDENNDTINFNLKDILAEQIKRVFSSIDEALNISNSAVVKGIQEFKKYLSEELSEEEESLLINKLYVLVEEITGDGHLKRIIGEEYYKELVSMVIIHSMKVTRVLYNYGMNKIDEIELREKIEILYEDYILGVVGFIKNNELIKEHAIDVLNFAFGNKAAAIQSVITKVAINMFDEEKREKVSLAFSKSVTKVKSWLSAVKNEYFEKGFERQYENPES